MDSQLKQELLEIAEILAKYPESLQERVFEIAIGAEAGRAQHHSNGADPPPNGGDDNVSGGKTPKKVPAADSAGKKRTGSAAESYAIVNSLDLKASGSIPSLQDFVAEKRPKSDPEFNTVAVYYLTKLKGAISVSLADIYTCYKTVKRKVPGRLSQGLRNTEVRHRFVQFSKGVVDITVTVLGENLVEQDLPTNPAE